MMIFELFMMSPILCNKSYEELIDDLRKGTLMGFISSDQDKTIFELLKEILLGG
jgi:hypothetical protein